MWQSRERWRRKAVNRANEARALRKKVKRLSAENQRLRDDKQGRRQQVPGQTAVAVSSPPAGSIPPATDEQTRVRCVILVVVAVISFRSCPRVLELFGRWFLGGSQWVPHFTSVINWTLRVGLALLSQVEPAAEPWVAIIDCSIDVGIKKVLVVLRVKLSALTERGSALTLADAECIGVEVAESWRGPTVAAALGRIFGQSGKPLAILKDQGSDLALGVKLWRQNHRAGAVRIIDDVGHVAANGLKAMFAGLRAFEKLLTAVKSGAAKIRQSDLAFLAPPKIRTKGRFQGISRLADWAIRILDITGGSGPKEAGSIADRLREFLPGFGAHRPLLHRLAWSTTLIMKVLDVLKNRGLTAETYAFTKKMLAELPANCRAQRRLMDWLERHWRVYQLLPMRGRPLPVSSDIIESLFGKLKTILARNPKAEFNRIILTIPCLCGKLTEAAVAKALGSVRHEDLRDWESKNIVETQCRKRRALFAALDQRADSRERRAG
jgi:hypothetical protein